jgi:hypothetical protein
MGKPKVLLTLVRQIPKPAEQKWPYEFKQRTGIKRRSCYAAYQKTKCKNIRNIKNLHNRIRVTIL